MKRHPLFPGFDKNKWGSFEIAAGYFLLGVLWILFSDKIAARLSPTTEALSQISIYKGWGYVLVTAVLLYWLIQRYAKNIQETNERYKLIAENSSDVIWLLDPAQGRFKYVSPSILKLRGYTAEEVMAMPVNDALLPEEVERLTALSTERISMLQSKGSGVMSFTDEIDQPHRDGSIVPTEVTTTYWFNEQNEIEVMGVTRDITRRKRTEKKLRESEKKYQELLDQASDGIFIADANGQYVIVNEEACRLVGYTKEELLSMNLRDLVAPEDLEATPLHLDELKTGKTLITERKLLHKNESRINCEISAKMLPNGSFQSIVRDITERKVTEDALIRSEKRYRSLFENMSNGFARCQMLYNEEGKPLDFIYLDVNNAFRKLTGLQDVIGKRVSEVIPGIHKSNPEIFEIYGRVARTGKAEKFETYLPSLGTGIWFSVSAYSSEKGFFVAVFETITERKQAEESLRRSYEQLLSFIEHAPLSIAMFDQDMNYLATSRRWIHDYGRGHTDLVGLNHYQINPDVPADWKEAHKKGLAGESMKNDDDQWVQADGSKYWLKWAITPWFNGHGKIGGIIISAEDISERKRAEAAAFRNEQRYHRVLDAMMEGCQIINFDWQYVYVNEVVAEQGRRKPEELRGHTMMEMYPGIEQTEMFRTLKRCMDNRTPQRMENQFIFPDGTVGWFELSVQPAEEGIFILSTDITERKRAEIALRDSEERLRLSLQAAKQGFYDLNVQTGKAVVNREYAEMLGYDFETFVETNAAWIERLHPDDQDVTAKAYSDYVNGVTQEYRVEFRQRTRDDHWKWILSLGKVVEYDAEGKPLRMLGTHTDITERKRAEENLLENERRYRELVQNANSAILRWKSDGTITFFNEYAQAFFGYSPEEILGRNVNILVPETESTGGDLTQLEQNIVEHPDQFVNVVNENICHDGHRVWMAWTNKPIYAENGDVSEILAVGVDITERKMAETALKQSEQKFSILFEKSAFSASLSRLSDGIIVNVNESFEKAFGYMKQEAIGKTSLELGINPDSGGRQRVLAALKESESAHNLELTLRTKSGESRVFSVNVDLVTIDGQKYILNTARDITESKQVEEEIRRLNEDLEARVIERTSQLAAANKELESFSYSVSHDLRAPLRAINGYTNILVEDYGSALDDEGRRVCSVISRETQRMGMLIDDLLSFSRLGRRAMRPGRIDMKALVDEVLSELLREEDQSRIEIHLGTLHPVNGDAALMRQVWVNLLSNAIKFTSKKERAIIEVQSAREDGEVTYSVRDNGTGFDMEYKNKLFGVFQRLHAESEFEGTGVGLAIVQRVIHRHDGRVWAEGRMNEGAAFHFALPERTNEND